MTTPRGLRNCNVGNIEDGPFSKARPGYAGTEPEGRFATFDSMVYGVAALVALLKIYRTQHGITTVRGIIDRWAPPSENQTSAYVHAVSAELGVGPDDALPDDPATYRKLAVAIAHHENGKAATDAAVLASDFDQGVAVALGIPAPWPFPTEQVRTITEPAETKMPAPFVAVAFEALSQLIPSLLRYKGTATAEKNAQLAEKVVGIAQQALGAQNAQDVVERVSSDPQAAAVVDKAVKEEWFGLQESGGGGIEGARKANLDASATPLWKQPAFVVSVLLLPLVYGTVYAVLFRAGFNDDVKIMVVSLVVGTTLGSIVGFFLGSSFTTSKSRGLGASSTQQPPL